MLISIWRKRTSIEKSGVLQITYCQQHFVKKRLPRKWEKLTTGSSCMCSSKKDCCHIQHETLSSQLGSSSYSCLWLECSCHSEGANPAVSMGYGQTFTSKPPIGFMGFSASGHAFTLINYCTPSPPSVKLRLNLCGFHVPSISCLHIACSQVQLSKGESAFSWKNSKCFFMKHSFPWTSFLCFFVTLVDGYFMIFHHLLTLVKTSPSSQVIC